MLVEICCCCEYNEVLRIEIRNSNRTFTINDLIQIYFPKKRWLDFSLFSLSVWGEVTALSQTVKHLDRIEICRKLTRSPNEIRKAKMMIDTKMKNNKREKTKY